MHQLSEARTKRKVLSLHREPNDHPEQPQFVIKGEAVFMVWREGGPAPKRVYAASEQDRAVSHAKMLCRQTGHRFHVLRSYRAFDPVVD